MSWLSLPAAFLIFIVQRFKAYNEVCWVRNTSQPVPIAMGQPGREALWVSREELRGDAAGD